MQPPGDYLRGSERLDLGAFGTRFAWAWSRMRSSFMKVECWQSYQELEANRSLAAFQSGDIDDAVRLLRREAEADRPLYERLRSHRLDFARLRLVQLPLTPYLRYEVLNYLIRRELGEVVDVIVIPSTVTLPSEDYFDFLLFDHRYALIHDYGDGLQRGGWATSRIDVLAALVGVVRDLRSRAVPLDDFLAGHPDWRVEGRPAIDDHASSTTGGR